MEILIDEVKKEGDTVNEERSVELILSLLIASYETTSTMTAIEVKGKYDSFFCTIHYKLVTNEIQFK